MAIGRRKMSTTTGIIVAVVGAYLAVGAVLLWVVTLTDLKKRRISLVGFLDTLSSLWAPFEVLYLFLWPLWYFSYRSREKKDRQIVVMAYGPDQAKYWKKEPIQPPQTTTGNSAPDRV